MLVLKTSRALGFVILILELASVGLFLVCGQTIFSIMGTATPGGGELPVLEDQETQTALITFTFTPRNTGLLAANLEMGFGMTITDGSFDTKNTTTVNIQPGAGREVSLSIRVPIEVLQRYANGGGTLDIYTSIRTLNDIVGLNYNVKSEGGG